MSRMSLLLLKIQIKPILKSTAHFSQQVIHYLLSSELLIHTTPLLKNLDYT